MKKRFFYSVITYFITMVSACLVNLAVSAMAVKIVNLFIVVDYFSAAIVRAVMAFVVISGVVGAMSYYESRKSAEFHPVSLSLAVALGGIAHLIISVPLMFYPFIAGGTRYLAGLMDMGSGFDSADNVKYIYLWTYLAAFGIYLVCEMISALVCGYLGKKNRENLRKELGIDKLKEKK